MTESQIIACLTKNLADMAGIDELMSNFYDLDKSDKDFVDAMTDLINSHRIATLRRKYDAEIDRLQILKSTLP